MPPQDWYKVAWLKPDHIKKYDGLSPLYNIMTAIKFGAAMGERKYFDAIYAEMLSQVSNWPAVIYEGIPKEEVVRLLHWAVDRYNKHPIRTGKLPDLSIKHLPRIPGMKTNKAWFEYMQENYVQFQTFYFYRLETPWDHWIVMSHVNKTGYNLLDSTGLFGNMQRKAHERGFKVDPMAINPKAIRPDFLIDLDNIYILTRIPR